LRPAQANNSQHPISKIIRAKCSGDVAQALEYLLQTPGPVKKKKTNNYSALLLLSVFPERLPKAKPVLYALIFYDPK
jgi:hypothetical protein